MQDEGKQQQAVEEEEEIGQEEQAGRAEEEEGDTINRGPGHNGSQSEGDSSSSARSADAPPSSWLERCFMGENDRCKCRIYEREQMVREDKEGRALRLRERRFEIMVQYRELAEMEQCDDRLKQWMLTWWREAIEEAFEKRKNADIADAIARAREREGQERLRGGGGGPGNEVGSG